VRKPQGGRRPAQEGVGYVRGSRSVVLSQLVLAGGALTRHRGDGRHAHQLRESIHFGELSDGRTGGPPGLTAPERPRLFVDEVGQVDPDANPGADLPIAQVPRQAVGLTLEIDRVVAKGATVDVVAAGQPDGPRAGQWRLEGNGGLRP
jgi:hypothetical protein